MPWESVLDLYRTQRHEIFTTTPDSIVSRLLLCGNTFSERWVDLMNGLHRKPNVEPLLATLHSILSSSKLNDDISSDLADLIGLDDIELIMEILENRSTVVDEVINLMIISAG